MLFGLANAPVVFMDLMNWVFRDYLYQFIVVFIDDILVYLKSHDQQHEDHLWTMLQVLREKRLFTKLKKCEFWLGNVLFLGHLVFEEDVLLDQARSRSSSIGKHRPRCRKSKFFLGLVDYYRKFVEGFSKIFLKRKNARYEWTEAYEKIFQEIKHIQVSYRPSTQPHYGVKRICCV